VETSKQTAENTAKMALSLDDFAKEQRKTNGKFYDRLHDHELSINELGQKTKAQVEEKKANATVTVAVISGSVGVTISIFNLAALLFNYEGLLGIYSRVFIRGCISSNTSANHFREDCQRNTLH